jgi:mono/diheme cytochrome c family protein
MRRALIATGLLVAAGALLAGCGSEGVVAPLPSTVEGTLPQATTPTPTTAKGNPAAGKAVFAANGCGGCHAYTPAGTNGTIGPNLDHLAADSKKANQGTLQAYTETSITDPSAYVVPGFPNGVMPSTYGTSLTPKQIADLVAFLTQKS